MNTIENLMEYGYCEKVASDMLRHYASHIGQINGDYAIVDMEYIGSGERIVTEVCRRCGYTFHKTMGIGNKFRDLRKKCPLCEKERSEAARKEKEAERLKPFYDEIGKTYGELTVIGFEGRRFICECPKCNTKRRVEKLKPTLVCRTCYEPIIKYDETYIGRKNNMLTIVGIGKKNGKKHFICTCDCGNTTLVKPIHWERGDIVSCGCYQENRSVDADEVHRIREIYHGMKTRCLNPNNPSYYNYGGRGIKICDEWLSDVNNFIEWSFANGYNNKLTIDRINPNGNYEPGNCRWTTYKIQNINRRPRGKKHVQTDK